MMSDHVEKLAALLRDKRAELTKLFDEAQAFQRERRLLVEGHHERDPNDVAGYRTRLRKACAVAQETAALASRLSGPSTRVADPRPFSASA